MHDGTPKSVHILIGYISYTQAPFGRGAETMVDTSVRLCRQVEAAEVELGEGWDAVVQRQAQKYCTMLGAQKEGEELVEARLYKMVLYEEGGFFKAHKDTEKEPGMFGTLVVQLPAKHEEGKLVVRHRGKEEEFDFSKGSSEGRLHQSSLSHLDKDAKI